MDHCALHLGASENVDKCYICSSLLDFALLHEAHFILGAL